MHSAGHKQPKEKRPRWKRRLLSWTLALIAGLNIFAAIHAYRFTHFGPPGAARTRDETELSLSEKLEAVAFGVSVPKAANDRTPAAPFSTLRIDSPGRREAWYLPAAVPVGTVILFHGYGGCRSGMLPKAERLRQLRFNCLLPDFEGSGGSEGNRCTVGYREADEVRAWYRYLRRRDSGRVFLLGQSMGAVAIMKAMADERMPVAGIILECPYGTMLRTVENRFESVGLPTLPMAQLLVFWGGALHGFNAFALRPEAYARSLRLPVLLIHGSLDKRVSDAETQAIFRNLPGPKQLLELPEAGHNDFLETCGDSWDAAVAGFLSGH